MTKPRTEAGIRARTDSNGATRYHVRVRRNGATLAATLPTLADAVVWRERAIAASEGKA